MVNVRYDSSHNAVVIEFIGAISVAEAYESYFDVEKAVPKEPGFRVLTDFTGARKFELEGRGAIERTMDLLNSRGVAEVIRVIPDPSLDIGFNIMSAFHYSKDVKVVTLQSREDAQAQMARP